MARRTGEEAEHAGARPIAAPGRRRRRIAAALILLLTLLVLTLWLVRKPMATRFIDRELARRGVPARYRVADLGLGRQRLTGVVIGDPAAPDLVADWIETDTAIGWTGPVLNGVRAGRVRLRGRWVDGRVRLGSIDRLLPPPSGKPFALPAIALDVVDARVVLATPVGNLAIGFAGKGRLTDDWRGRARLTAPRLATSGCVGERLDARLAVTIRTAAPRLVGPVGLARLRCDEVRVAAPGATIDVRLAAALDAWSGHARVATGAAAMPRGDARVLAGTIGFNGTPRATGGTVDLAAAAVRAAEWSAARLRVEGRWGAGPQTRFDVRIEARRVRLPDRWRATLAGVRVPPGTPVSPVADTIRRGVLAAAASGDAAVALGVRTGPDGAAAVALREGEWRTASGARVTFGGGTGVRIGGPGWRVDTRVAAAGGGLPTVTATLARRDAGRLTGTLTMRRFVAGDAALAVDPVRFAIDPNGGFAASTRATVSGPLGDGRVEGLVVPLVVRGDGRGAVTVNPDCAPLDWRRLVVSGTAIEAARLRLCPTGGGWVRLADGRVSGGARTGAVRLAGRIGGSPVALAVAGGSFDLAAVRFTLTGVETRIGRPDRATRIDVAQLDGQVARGTVGGTFAGGAGQVGAVPLLIGDAAGQWRLAGGELALTGSLGVRDAAIEAPRFKPMTARDVRFTLRGNAIAASGVLAEPTTGTRVADVRLRHDLRSGRGDADIRAPALAFREGFQPDLLTPLTFGVVADVRGTVTGEGHIAWTSDGVTSDGIVRTDGLDLAAAFGPVRGIATAIRFTDLLALASTPGQVATIASVNPGIEVTDGRVVYQLLPDTRVRVDGGRWPFAGGTLTLEPTLLDFGEARDRRLTFRVDGVAADRFLQQFDFKNLEATGTFDGVLPMIFGDLGGRIAGGSLTVREGGGTIAYVGELGQKQLGVWGDLAFQALRSLRYRSLGITMNGPLSGEMVTQVRFAGISQGEGAKRNFLVRRLQRLPFVFNVTVRAPFRGLLDTAQSFYDPKRLVERNLPQLIERQNASTPAIQPPASETVP